jgi:rubrerythrin
MKLNTASAVISLARQLENDSAKFYEDLSARHAKDKDIILSFAKENRKNVAQIERVYFGVITDAIEGCFAFNIDTDGYTFESGMIQNESYHDALDRAITIEKQLIKFYSDAAEQSKTLMADIPRAFLTVARKRDGRVQVLRSLLEKDDS